MKALGGESGTYNGEEFVIVNALGHLYQLDSPEKQVSKDLSGSYADWDLSNLPWDYNDLQWNYKMNKGAQKHLREIKNKLKDCDEIVIATDVDPTGEGDLLAGEIILKQGLDKKKLSRMDFTDESVKTLQQAFVDRRPVPKLEDDLNYQKALFRSKWDFLSMQFTRIATNVSPAHGVIRQGRLKSTMVSLAGGAIDKLANYEKIPYFQNRFIDENKVIYTNPAAKKYPNKKDVPTDFKESEVIIDKVEMKKTPPPMMVDLARLSSMLAPKGYEAEEILNTYQKMYEEDILSYPRTSDKKIKYSQFDELLLVAHKIAEIVGVDPGKLTHREPRKTHISEKATHGANRPGPSVPKDLDSLKRFGRAAIPIYTLLARNFLAMLFEDYEYERQIGYIKDYPKFTGSTNVPKVMGWKEVFSTDDIEDEVSLGLGKLGKPFVHEGFPPKPPAPTMGWLMRQLEKHNVGNGSTRTSTYSEVTSKRDKYALMKSDKGRITMTSYGEISKQLLKGTKIGNVKTSEEVLSAMDEIGEGNTDLIEEKLNEVQDLINHDLKVMRENAKSIELPDGLEPPKFARAPRETMKNEKGKEISFKKEWGGHKFTEEELGQLSSGESITIDGLKNRHGKKYSAKGKIVEQEFKKNKFWGFKMTEYTEEGKDTVVFKE